MAADAGLIDCCAGIDVRPTVEEQGGPFGVAVFRCHMQERCSLKRELAPTGHATIEFRETLMHECGIGINVPSQTLEPASEQLQHGWGVVFGCAACLEKDVYAGAQSFCRTRVRRDDVVESRAWIWMAGHTPPWVATVRICAVIEEPSKSVRRQ